LNIHLNAKEVILVHFFFERPRPSKKVDQKEENDEREDDADNDARDDVGGVVLVVGNPSEGDVQSKTEEAKLEKQTDEISKPVEFNTIYEHLFCQFLLL